MTSLIVKKKRVDISREGGLNDRGFGIYWVNYLGSSRRVELE